MNTRPHRRPVPTAATRGYLLLPVALALALVASVALLLTREGTLESAIEGGQAQAEAARFIAEAGLAHAEWVAQTSGCTGYALGDTSFGADSYRANFTPQSGSPVAISATATLASGTQRTLRREAVTVFESRGSTVLGTSGDTFVREGPNDTNQNAEPVLITHAGDTPHHALLAFDLSTLPPDANVLSAELSLYGTELDVGPAPSIAVHRMLVPWDAAAATYQSPDGAGAWAWPNNHDPVPAATVAPGVAPPAQWSHWNLTKLVADWVRGSVPNHGLLLVANADVHYAQFASSGAADPALRPTLSVTHACECGGVSRELELRPGPGGRDSYLNDGPQSGANFGSNTFVTASGQPFSVNHGLLHFALPALPPGASVAGATLWLELDRIGSNTDGTVYAHRVTESWAEDETSWDERQAGVAWTTPGGSYEPVPAAASAVYADQPGPVSWDLSALVADWYAGTHPNFGLLLRATTELDHVNFFSGDAADAATHPRLRLRYSCPCGVPCSLPTACSADFSPNTRNGGFPTGSHAQGHTRGLTFVPEGVVVNAVPVPAGGAFVGVDSASGTFLTVAAGDGNLVDDTLPAPGTDLHGVAWVASGPRAGQLAVVRGSPASDTLYFVDPASGGVLGSYDISAFMQRPGGVTWIENSDSGAWEGLLAIVDAADGRLYFVDESGAAVGNSAFLSGTLSTPEGLAHLPGSDRLLVIDAHSDTAIVASFDGSVHRSYDLAAFDLPSVEAAAIDPLSCAHVLGNNPSSATGGDIDEVAYLDDSAVAVGTTVALSAVQDTFLAGAQTIAYGNADSLLAGFGVREWRPLLQFDVSSIPAGSVVHSATLRMQNWDDGSPTVGLVTLAAHRVTEPWDQIWGGNGANWLERERQASGTLVWVTPGGSYDPAWSSAQSFDSSIAPQWVEWTLTPLVQEWVDGVSPNDGVLLIPAPGSASANLRSTDFSDASVRPQLVVTYTAP